jgi:outer membrane cobalamin receptor
MSTLALGGSYNVQPLIVMDGVILSLSSDVKSFLQSIDPSSVDFIEVLKGPQAAAYGMQGAGGVILINSTNERKQVSQINDKGISTIYPMGYAKQVEFNSPDYDKKEIKKAAAPDQRITIYWNANLITDEKGSASAYFFTGDNRTTYTVILTGITTTGNILTKKLRFKEIN